MKKALAIIFSFGFLFLTSGNNADVSLTALYRKGMNIGSAKTFLGECLFINIFLSDNNSSFTTAEKQKELNDIQKSELYFKEKAEKNNRRISMIYDKEDLIIDYKTDFIIPTVLEDFLWTFTTLSSVYSECGLENIISYYNPDNVIFVFHVDKPGRSYSLAQEYGLDSFYDNEIMVLYEYESFGEHIFIHETLHLFGAIDLYYPFNPEDERILLAEKYFHDSIMLSYPYDVYDSDIREIEAYLIGWTDHLDEKYIIFFMTE